VAGATPSYSVDFYSFGAFILPSCLLPVVFYGTETPEGFGPIIGMFLLYLIVMARVSSQSHENLMRNFELSFALNYRATHDALSGLLNRQELENKFLTLTPNTSHGVAMLFLDLDNFKLLNDTLGHQAGDEAIMQVAGIMRDHVRDDDICARLGGDEFVVLLYIDDPSVAERIGHAIIADINDLDFGNPDFPGLGCSAGLAFKTNNAIRYSDIMKEADASCYISKKGGKNQLTFRNII
jgi:diguanylate cyclase (GGDEF)-like protein